MDTPTQTGRNFLKKVLTDVCEDIASDVGVDEALRDLHVDSDTQGVAGQPPIVETIFKKIDASGVYIADMTFVGSRNDGRPTSNPNVLMEYGYALNGLKHERVLCVMNTAYGEPSDENLPFNMKHVRWPICYNLPEDATPEMKAQERKKLTAVLNDAIRASLATLPDAAIEAVTLFPASLAKDGPARFRNAGEAIGVEDESLMGSNREIFLSPGPAMWLRLMPVTDPGKQWVTHDLKSMAVRDNTMNLSPILNGEGGYSYVRAGDGMGMFRPNPGQGKASFLTTESIAFAFETGEVWSIDTAYLSFREGLPFLEPHYIQRIKGYARFLQSLGIEGPYRWIAGMTGIGNRHFNYPPQRGYERFGPGPVCLADTIEAEGTYDGQEDASKALMPFFKKIFAKCGVSRPDYLSEANR